MIGVDLVGNDDVDKIFYLEKIISDPVSSLKLKNKTIDEIKDDCIFVFDTNVLLAPYEVKSKLSFDEIKLTYKKLVEEEKLIIPTRALREFIKNRGKLILNLVKELKTFDDFDHLRKIKIPMFEGEDNYETLLSHRNDINKQINEFQINVSKFIDNIKNLTVNDPLVEFYANIITTEVIFEYFRGADEKINQSKKDMIEELKYRYTMEIPPGYADSEKSDKGVGDLLIWKSVIEISKQKDKNIIFVTNETKSDWWYSEKKVGTIIPRIELITEFYNKTKGKSIQLVDLSKLIEIRDGNQEVIDELRKVSKPGFATDRVKKLIEESILSQEMMAKTYLKWDETIKMIYKRISETVDDNESKR